jgi:hypothetical protein
MSNVIEIELPRGANQSEAQALRDELTRLTDVHSSDVVQPKAIDPASLIVWVKLAAAALPVLTAVVNLIRGRRMKNVRLKVGDNSIEVDSASPAELEKVLVALREQD